MINDEGMEKITMQKHLLMEQFHEWEAVQREYQKWNDEQKEFLLWRIRSHMKVAASEIKSTIRDYNLYRGYNNFESMTDRVLAKAGISA